MDAVAPAALALSVSFDAVASLALLLMAVDEGTVVRALLPRSGDARLDIAAGLADLVACVALRGLVVMLPLLGVPGALSRPGLAAAAAAEAGVTGWLAAKAALAVRLAGGQRLLRVAATGVVLQVPLLLAAELLGVLLGWLQLLLLWASRGALAQPAGGGNVALALALGALQQQQLQQRLAVQEWVASSSSQAGGEGDGPELMAPLLGGEVGEGAEQQRQRAPEEAPA